MSKITEGNKLLSEFMGGKVTDNIFYCNESTISHNERCLHHYNIHCASYISKWDWLMPVIQKINSLEHLNLWHKYNVDRYNLTEAIDKVDIEYAFDLCVDFVKWYNLEV